MTKTALEKWTEEGMEMELNFTWASCRPCDDVVCLLLMSKHSTASKQSASVVLREFLCPEGEVATLRISLTSRLASFHRGLHRTTSAGEIVDGGIFHIGLEASGNPSFAVAVAVTPLSVVRVAPVLIVKNNVGMCFLISEEDTWV